MEVLLKNPAADVGVKQEKIAESDALEEGCSQEARKVCDDFIFFPFMFITKFLKHP